MSFLFASSHLPAIRSTRPEPDDDEEDVNPDSLPRSGGVRASSHLPERREAEAPYRALSQRGAQAGGRQLQRREESEDEATPHQDGVAAAKASGVFDAVRQQFNRDDSPHFMDEDGNLRPRDGARPTDSPAQPDARGPQRLAVSPPSTSWSHGHDDVDDDSIQPRLTASKVSDDTSPWHMPPITQEVLDTYGFNGGENQAADRRSGYFRNATAPSNDRPHFEQQTRTYGAAQNNHARGSNTGHASNLGSDNQSATTASAPSASTGSRSIFQDANDGHKKYETETAPTVEMLEQKEKHLQQEVAGVEMALHKHYEGIERLRKISIAVHGAGSAQEIAKHAASLGVDLAVELGNEALHLDPKEIIEKIDAEISQRHDQAIKYQEDIAKAKGALMEARSETETAKHEKKKRELEEKRKQQLEQKQRQQLEDKRRWESEERQRKLQELKEKYEQELKRQKQAQQSLGSFG